MPRKMLIRSKEFPYHITARGNNREHFPCNQEEMWEILCDLLIKSSTLFHIRVHALVLMPNHFHLLISTTDDLGDVMQYYMRSVTKTVNSRTRRSGRIFGAKYHWSLIDNHSYYDCVLKYVYRNPVKAKLCSSVEDYLFSTLKFALGKTSSPFPLEPPIGILSLIPEGRIEDFLLWLNQPFLNEQDSSIQKGLKKTYFSPPKVEWKRKSIILESFVDAVGITK